MRRFLLLASFFLLAVAPTFSQTPQTGLYAFGAYDSPGFDTINRGNLNVHFTIPIFSKPGRAGTNFSFTLNYDSLIWTPSSTSGSGVWQPAANWGWTTVSNAEFGYISYNLTSSTCTIPPHGIQGFIYTYNNFVYHDQRGVSHPFNYTYTSTCNGSFSPTGSGSYVVTDNSYYTIYRSGTAFVVFTKTGEQYSVSAIPKINGHQIQIEPAGVYTDTNGNQITATYNSSTSTTTYTDTLGQTALTVTGGGTPSSPFYYAYTDTTGTLRQIQVNYTAYNVTTNFGVSGVTEYTSSSIPLVSSIVYPDGSQYAFTYEYTHGSTTTYTGRIASVTLPTGGRINYAYTGGSNGIESDGSTSGLNRTTSDSTTPLSYLRSGVSGTASTTTYTDAYSPTNTSVSSYLEDASGYIYETSRSVYQGAASGMPLQQVTTCYAQVSGCPANSVTAPIEYVTTTLALNGITVLTDTQQYTGGFLVGNNDGYVNETTTYQGFTGTDSIGFARVLSVTDQTGSTQIAKTSYAYDELTGTGHAALTTTSVPQHVAAPASRGNLTTVSPWLNTSNTTFGPTMAAYYDTGSPVSSLGPTGSSSYSYDTTNSFLNGWTPPTPSSGVSLPSAATYDTQYTGLPLTATDPNNQVITYNAYNSMLQPTEVTYPDGGSSQYYWYNPYSGPYAGYSIVRTQNNSSSTNSGFQVDGYGRSSRQALSNGQSTNPWYQQDTCYDADGRISFSSYRYQGNAWSTPKVCSGAGDTYSYDPLGRVTKIAHADGTYITYGYKGHATQVTDENGISRITQADGHGRVATVCEISSTTLQGVAPVACGTDITGQTGFLTTYAYTTDSSANQMTTVTQGAQTRIIKTDSLGRTVSVTEPERGTTTYSYAYSTAPVVGLTVTRKRPQANQTNASILTTTTTQYDAVGRVASVTYNDGLTPNKSYFYDVNPSPSWAETLTNPKGRLALALSGMGSTLAETLFSYDPMGRVLTMWQCAPSICGTANQAGRPALSFSYDWTGNLTGEFDGASGQINYTRSPAGEVTLITNQSYSLSGSAGPTTIVSSAQNGPNGPISYSLGNGLETNLRYDSLGRPNGKFVCSGSVEPNCTGGTELYGVIWTVNGSQVQQESDTVLNQQMTFGYDSFNRLTSRAVYAGTAQNYTYSYDRYGNRWSQTLTAGSGPQPSYSFSATTNQVTTTGYTYDAAGNMTQDGPTASGGHIYTHDAEGNILTVDGGSAGNGQYTYDALNRRVRVQTPAATYEYLYDYAGRRTSSWLNPTSGEPGSGNEGRIYWDGQQIAYRAWDGTTYFEHQDWLGTERMRTNYTGAVAANFTSLPWGDDSSATIGGTGSDQDNAIFAGLDLDTVASSGAPMSYSAQYRNYSFSQGRWLAPDPYDGSYDITNPQSFNRYAYVLNNPLTFLDPSGLKECPFAPCNGPPPPTPNPDPPPTNPGCDGSCDGGGNHPTGGGGNGNAPNGGPLGNPTLKKLTNCPSQAAAASQAYNNAHPSDPLAASASGSLTSALVGAGLGARAGATVGGIALIPFGPPVVPAAGAAEGAVIGGLIGAVRGAITGPLTTYLKTQFISATIYGGGVVGCLLTPASPSGGG